MSYILVYDACILADEMGLGKTIQTISFLASLMENKNNMGPHIILATKVCRNSSHMHTSSLHQVSFGGGPPSCMRAAQLMSPLSRQLFA